MRHASTVILLWEWGRWGTVNNIDYPSMSPMFGERALKTPLYSSSHMPEDVAKIEKIVCGLEWIDREILILKYVQRLKTGEMAERIHRRRQTAWDRLMAAEREVRRKWTEMSCADSAKTVPFNADSKTVTS